MIWSEPVLANHRVSKPQKKRQQLLHKSRAFSSPALRLSSTPHPTHTQTHSAQTRTHRVPRHHLSHTQQTEAADVYVPLLFASRTQHTEAADVCASGLLSHRHRQGRGSRGTTAHREFLPPPPPTTRTRRRTLEMDIILTACV